MRRTRAALSTLVLLTALAHGASAQPRQRDGLTVRLEAPGGLHAGDRTELTAWVSGGGTHPVLVTPRSEGTAVEVVRGRILRAEARDPAADPLEFRIPVVAHRAGTAVVRVTVAGYACRRLCRRVERETSLVLRVLPERDAPGEQHGGPKKQAQEMEARTSSLSWVRLPGADGCLGSAELARAVETQLDRSVFVSAADAAIAVEGRAEPGPDGASGVRAVIQVTDRDGARLGERTIDAADCDALGEMVVVAIALMIDPLTAPAETSSPAVLVRTERVEVPIEVPVEVPVEVPSETPPPRRWRVEIDSAIVGQLGLLPTPMVGGLTTVLVEPPDFVPIALEGALFPFSRAEPSDTSYVDFLHVHAGLMICPLWVREGGLALHACLGADAGAVVVIGGTDQVDEGERLIGQGHVAVRGHWDVVGPLTMRLALHFLVPFRHDVYSIGGVPFYSPEPIAGMIDLGVGVHFD